MDIRRYLFRMVLAGIALWLSACVGKQLPAPPVRAVKLETVGTGADAGSRFVATVHQQQRAELAFENGGRLAAVAVDVGDHVRTGQVLARLDPAPARLRVIQARAGVAVAIAQLQERQVQQRQQRAMFDDGSVSQATLTAATTALAVAQAQLRSAQSDLDQAQRAQRMAVLRAPFDGTVSARLLQSQAEVAPGQAVLRLEGQGRPQAVALLPQAGVAALAPGALLQARAGSRLLGLRLRSFSPQLESGAAVLTIFDLTDAAAPVSSGQILLLALPPGRPVPMLPLAGVLPGEKAGTAAVFVYQPAAGTVRRRQVRLGAIEGERVQIVAGLAPGEQVVAAGAAFLTDGEKVLPFRSASRLAEEGTP